MSALDFAVAPDVVKSGGDFRIIDSRYEVTHDYRVARGVKCWIVFWLDDGVERYIGHIHYDVENRFKHGGPKATFRRTHEIVRTFDRVWRRYLHPMPPIPSIEDEISIVPI